MNDVHHHIAVASIVVKCMNRFVVAAFSLLFLALSPVTHAAQTWTQGKQYRLLQPIQRTTVPAGKVEVLEVFSYGCIACNSFQPIIEKLKSSLPPNAQMAFLHASFNSTESWPLFQRAYYAAESLGIAERSHQALFDAIWKTGELAVVDSTTRQLRNPQPTLDGVARFYARATGIMPDAFLAAARSFAVESKMRAADVQIASMKVSGTPTLIVNGKYRVDMNTVESIEELIDLVKFLVVKEGTR
jgi:protein dithiol oxidoreductase (disulfide-forming)